jgi:hypothetical protein
MLPTGPLISCEQSGTQPRWEVVEAVLTERCPVHTSTRAVGRTAVASSGDTGVQSDRQRPGDALWIENDRFPQVRAVRAACRPLD